MDETKYLEFKQKMEQSYPKMFAHRYGGFAVGEGWWPILESLCANIDSHIKWQREKRANDLVFNRRLKHAIATNSIAPFVEAYKRRTQMEPSKWTLEGYEEALTTQEFRDVSNTIPNLHVRQIKEKFGGLRFYYDGGDEYIHGMVRMAESWAARTCERCGQPGTLRPGGWIRTLCDKHEEERQAEMKERFGEDYDAT